MEVRNPLSWKTAALPLAALTAALAVGVGYFAGGSSQDASGPAGSASQFKFEPGPRYAPGSRPGAQAAQAGSSIDLFQEANKNYSAETAAAASSEPVSRRPKDKKALREFMQQVRHDINMDPAALAAAEAAGTQGGGAGRTGSGPLPRKDGGPEQAAAVQARQAGAGGAGRHGSLGARNQTFSAGRSAAGLSGRSGGLKQPRGIGSGFVDAESAGAGQDTGYAMSSGGRDMQAGAYGSHGGGGASSPQMSGGASSEEKKGGGGMQQEKEPPAAVAFIWPRSFDFGDMYTYETASRQVIVMNIGNAALKLGKIENMDDETPFYAEKDKCSGGTLAPGKSCTFRVRFSPQAAREYVTGFEIPSNDGNAMAYQGFIEVKGNSKYSYATWWWHNHWSGAAGYSNRLNFGLVPEGYTMEEVLRITNTSGDAWEDIKLDTSKLPSSFRISGDGCSGGNLGPHQSCAVTVTFAPSAAVNRQFSTAYYGQYHAVNTDTGARLFHPRPKFPPMVLESPVEAAPAGKLLVRAHYSILHTGQVVLEIPVKAASSAPFPVAGLARVQHYFFFQ